LAYTVLMICKTFERLCGNNACIIDLHLHCHLAQVLYDYGPAHDAWYFSFERYN